jgi:hypothetical protein
LPTGGSLRLADGVTALPFGLINHQTEKGNHLRVLTFALVATAVAPASTSSHVSFSHCISRPAPALPCLISPALTCCILVYRHSTRLSHLLQMNHDHHAIVAQNVDHATTKSARRFGHASSLMHTIDNTSAPSTLIHTIDSIPASVNLIYITKSSPAPNTAHALTANKHAIMTQMKMAFVKIAVKQLLLSQLLLSQLLYLSCSYLSCFISVALISVALISVALISVALISVALKKK